MNWRNEMRTGVNNCNNEADVMKSVEEATDRAVNAQVEKNLFLGEYKERIIKALTFEEIKEKGSGEQKETAENMTYRVNENRILHFVWINYHWGKDPHFMSEGYLLEK